MFTVLDILRRKLMRDSSSKCNDINRFLGWPRIQYTPPKQVADMLDFLDLAISLAFAVATFIALPEDGPLEI